MRCTQIFTHYLPPASGKLSSESRALPIQPFQLASAPCDVLTFSAQSAESSNELRAKVEAAILQAVHHKYQLKQVGGMTFEPFKPTVFDIAQYVVSHVKEKDKGQIGPVQELVETSSDDKEALNRALTQCQVNRDKVITKLKSRHREKERERAAAAMASDHITVDTNLSDIFDPLDLVELEVDLEKQFLPSLARDKRFSLLEHADNKTVAGYCHLFLQDDYIGELTVD